MREPEPLTIEEMAEIPEMTGNFVEDSHNLARLLSVESQEVYTLAQCFRRTGNSEVYEELMVLSSRLSKLSSRASDICGTKVSGDLKASEESTSLIVGTMLKGILDGSIDPSRRRKLPGEKDLAETAPQE